MGEYIAFAVMQVDAFFPVQSLHPTRAEAQKAADDLAESSPGKFYYLHKMTREQAIEFFAAIAEVRRRIDKITDSVTAERVAISSKTYCKGGADSHAQSVKVKGFCDFCGKGF